jgi:hypothetical protein
VVQFVAIRFVKVVRLKNSTALSVDFSSGIQGVPERRAVADELGFKGRQRPAAVARLIL